MLRTKTIEMSRLQLTPRLFPTTPLRGPLLYSKRACVKSLVYTHKHTLTLSYPDIGRVAQYILRFESPVFCMCRTCSSNQFRRKFRWGTLAKRAWCLTDTRSLCAAAAFGSLPIEGALARDYPRRNQRRP